MKHEKQSSSADRDMQVLFTMLLAVVSPFLLIIVEQIIPNPHLVEETTKLLIILYLVKKIGVNTVRYWQVLLIGFLFAMTETVLFVMDAFVGGDVTQLLLRFLFTVPMHTFTPALIYTIGRKGKLWWFVGLLLAIIIHAEFNSFVRGW